jgi:2-keto-4-pentenoate hydratase/2-oxohepta-3-ene-1,7-dioic acid hydratase in catechol pathway
MRIANIAGRTVLLDGATALDVATASEGRFGPEPHAVYDDWDAFSAWAQGADVAGHPAARPYTSADLDTPVPRPSQVFGIGLNYADHAAEANLDVPENPLVFTKFPSSLAGADTEVGLSGDHVDWEAELVVVIGRTGRDIDADDAWDHVAGLSVGQDLSDRTVQNWGSPAQFNLGKSFAGYAPVGPAVVTVDEVRADHDVDALFVRCALEDEHGARTTLQDGNTRDLIFSVPELVARLSAIVELRAGDLIFTGTPAGVGMGRKPPQFLAPGQTLVTEIEGLGTIRQRLV